MKYQSLAAYTMVSSDRIGPLTICWRTIEYDGVACITSRDNQHSERWASRPDDVLSLSSVSD